jgi:hypothetical protein
VIEGRLVRLDQEKPILEAIKAPSIVKNEGLFKKSANLIS